MSGRDAILGRLKRGIAGDEATRRAAVLDRLAARAPGPIPAKAKLEGAALVDHFVAQAESVATTTERVASAAEVPAAIAAYLRSRNLPQAVRRGTDPRLAALPFETEAQLDVSVGPSTGRELVGLSAALAGVSETGTVVLVSGEDNPTTLNFLPDHHLVVVFAEDLVGSYEDVWARIRARRGEGQMPRAVNMITGPSRSGDIEQTMLLGAHGPRALHLIVVGA